MEIHVEILGKSAAATTGTFCGAAAYSELQRLDGWRNARWRRRPKKVENGAHNHFVSKKTD